MEIILELFDFAFISNYDDRFSKLAELAEKETWDFSDSQNKTNAILKNYIQYTFKKIDDDRQIAYTADNKYACFNTGLTTPYYEDIFALFTEHHGLKSGKTCQPFYLLGFLKESDPKLAQYFSGNIAVPQYYNGKIQLLLPLYLSHSENPDLALALEQHEKCYIARTCLTMKMAYNNARLITKPQSTWLKP